MCCNSILILILVCTFKIVTRLCMLMFDICGVHEYTCYCVLLPLLLLLDGKLFFTVMAESRMSNCWVEQKAYPQAQASVETVEFVPLLRSWISSLHQKLTILSMCLTNAHLPRSTTNLLQSRRLRVRLRLVPRQPVPVIQALRPP